MPEIDLRKLVAFEGGFKPLQDIRRFLGPLRSMDKVALLKARVQDLSPEGLAQFREWFEEFDAEVWDRKFEADVRAGKLEALAERALQAHTAKRPT